MHSVDILGKKLLEYNTHVCYQEDSERTDANC